MTTYEEERAMDQAFEAHQDRLATEQDEREAAAGRVVRYVLITVTLPDGSNGTPDPEDEVEAIIDSLDRILTDNAEVAQVYPDDLVRGGD